MLTFYVVSYVCLSGLRDGSVCPDEERSGLQSSQVTVLEEGINTDNRSAKEFWSLLGGKTDYRGKGT